MAVPHKNEIFYSMTRSANSWESTLLKLLKAQLTVTFIPPLFLIHFPIDHCRFKLKATAMIKWMFVFVNFTRQAKCKLFWFQAYLELKPSMKLLSTWCFMIWGHPPPPLLSLVIKTLKPKNGDLWRLTLKSVNSNLIFGSVFEVFF